MSNQEKLTSDTLFFLFKFLKSPRNVGAIAPSSYALAEAMTKYVIPENRPKRYLEVGPGTGAFTDEIVNKLGPDDHFDVVELDLEFCTKLQNKYSNRKNILIHHGSILEWSPQGKYDLIVSSIPLNALKSEHVEKILEKYQYLLAPNGLISFFEYIGLPAIRKFFSKKEYKKTRELLSKFVAEHEVSSQNIWRNLPPALVHHLASPR